MATRLLFAFFLVGVLFFGVFPEKNQQPAAVDNTVASSSLKALESVGLPVALKIPKINIDAKIEYVGLAANGAMAVPKNRDNVAWLKIGARPGEIGSAVMAGHYGVKNKQGSVFDNLYKLQAGDELLVEDEAGAITTFVVIGIERYNFQSDAADVFISSDGKSHLNLITCEGDWDEIANSYPERLVVFADKK